LFKDFKSQPLQAQQKLIDQIHQARDFANCVNSNNKRVVSSIKDYFVAQNNLYIVSEVFKSSLLDAIEEA